MLVGKSQLQCIYMYIDIYQSTMRISRRGLPIGSAEPFRLALIKTKALKNDNQVKIKGVQKTVEIKKNFVSSHSEQNSKYG